MLVGACFTLFKMRKSLGAGIVRSIANVKKAATQKTPTDSQVEHKNSQVDNKSSMFPRIERDIPFN
jgi:hypothetical protein